MSHNFRSFVLIVLTALMLLSYQNCGSARAGGESLNTPASIGLQPVTSVPAEKQLLTQVLTGYQSCDSIAGEKEQNACRRLALENAANSNPPAVTQKAEDGLVCYVFGPGCAEGVKRDLTPVGAVQSCRNELFSKGFSVESVNTLMRHDPLGYAEMINSSCLYGKHQCVVAVRCVLKSETNLPGSIESD